ncbi:hypothetical protein QUF79_00855 [Fictibacillus enclensis]|uniref:hypothetical protein n=1 Tax=Fictibacillus enclensis TaxID=1017270 RepID=UPI0025A0396F|nr:hypothetical protein [Fictibacillus enclensis]MDM5196638.1 hypothetical protein [Fictibacillus enclensis]
MANLPSPVIEFLKDNDVDLSNIEDLKRVNPNRGVFSYRAYSRKRSYILKNCINKREFDVYTKHFTFFYEKNINIPDLYFSCSRNGENWIIIEDIPNIFPRSR